MIYRCRFCPRSGELRNGKLPNNNMNRYRRLELKINQTGAIKIHSSSSRSRLCPDCLKKMADLIKK
jgi:hypothetical protein